MGTQGTRLVNACDNIVATRGSEFTFLRTGDGVMRDPIGVFAAEVQGLSAEAFGFVNVLLDNITVLMSKCEEWRSRLSESSPATYVLALCSQSDPTNHMGASLLFRYTRSSKG